MDLVAQAKVLRALQSGEISRVGSEHVIHVDVRVLAATNKDLAKAVESGTFREDLFFRLDVFPIRSPALRERVEDIPLLAEAFMDAVLRARTASKPKPIDDDVIAALVVAQVAGQRARAEERGRARGHPLAATASPSPTCPEDPHESPFGEESRRARPPSVAAVDRRRSDDRGRRAGRAPAAARRQAPDAARVPREVRAAVHRRHAAR